MATKLTDAAIKRLAVSTNGDTKITWDTMATGLGLKVTPRGKRIWALQLKYPGNRVQAIRTLGHYPGMTLEAARRKAELWYGLVKQGIDPADVAKEERKQADAERGARVLKQGNTFATFAEHYIEGRINRRADMDAREIRRMLIAEWGDRPIHEILPRDVRQLIEEIKPRAPYEARNGWTHLVGIFKLAVHEELIEVSPCASLDKKLLFKGVKIEPRQRVLSDDEVFAFWRASGRVGYPGGPISRLLLLTGCRVSEVVGASWSELHPELRQLIRKAQAGGRAVNWASVDDSIKTLTIPRERFKSNAEHIVPLTDDACAVLEGLSKFAGCDLLFTSNRKTPAWFGPKIKARIDARMLLTLRALARKRGDDPALARLEPWVNHDLRRVVRTNLAALNVEDHVAEMVIGHGRKGIQRVYDQHKYEPEMREALEAWAARLHAIAEPAPATPPTADNVVALQAKRRARR